MVIFLDWFSVLLLMGAAAGLLVLRNWRWSLILLAAIYLGVFWLVSRHWPVGMAAVKLVTGWMAAAVLGISQMNAPAEDTFEPAWPEGRAFRLLVAGLAVAVTAAIAPAVTGWLGVVPAPAAWGGALLISLGVAHLGMTARPMRVALGLLTLLAGFETVYAFLEGSILVTALLAGINLGLALVGAYFIHAPEPEVET